MFIDTQIKPIVPHIYIMERRVEQTINCSWGDNGVSIWCALPDEVLKLSKENKPQAFPVNASVSFLGNASTTSSARGFEVRG